MVTGTQLLPGRKDSAHDGDFTGEVLERLTQLNGMWQGYAVLLKAKGHSTENKDCGPEGYAHCSEGLLTCPGFVMPVSLTVAATLLSPCETQGAGSGS